MRGNDDGLLDPRWQARIFLFASAMFPLTAALGFLSDLVSTVLVASPAPEAGR